MLRFAGLLLAAALAFVAGGAQAKTAMQVYPLPPGLGAHDVWPAADGGVWFTAQAAGKLGHLDPGSGKVDLIALGARSAPHGVIVGADGAPWITDGGQNAIVRVDPATRAPKIYPLPKGRENANLNTASFDRSGVLWFTGQNGVYGRLDPRNGEMSVYDAPRGTGPYGIATTPEGRVFYASLAGSYVAEIELASGQASVLEPPVPRQGARRVWSDGEGNLWITGWSSGDLFCYDPKAKAWKSWRVPGNGPQPYAVYVDERGIVWLSDWGSNAIFSFDPKSERFDQLPLLDRYAGVRELAGRKGEVWGAESGADKIFVIRVTPD